MIALILAPLALAPLALAPPPVQDKPDLVVLKDGKEIDCRVLHEDDELVIYRDRRNREVPMSEISEIHSIERSLVAFFEQFERIAQDDTAALGDLALWCEANELHGEARNLWIRIILLDPENERAWTKLGASHGRKGWRLKVRGRYYTLAQLRERVSDWKNAMEIPTAHFLLKTDIDPMWAMNVSIDLERAYMQFYDLLGKPLKLFVFDEVPEVHVFSDPNDYPTPPTARDAWFSRSANTCYALATESRNSHEIIQNFTYLLTYNFFHRTMGKTGNIEPWARRGVAEAFAAGARVDSGRTKWEMGVPYLPHFEFQARDDEPLSIEEVVRAGITSFDSGTNQQRYIAQSYTLTYFLALGAQRRYRAGFAAYFQSSYGGQGSTKTLEKLLGVDLDELEVEWNAFVREMAGT